MKALVIAFALVSLICFVLAVRDWHDEAAGPSPRADTERSHGRGVLILTVVSLLTLAGLWVAAEHERWGLDRALWIGFGGFLALATLIRPWWFWDNYKARWLRRLIGDEATAVFYLAVSAVMVWVGLFTDWRFGRH